MRMAVRLGWLVACYGNFTQNRYQVNRVESVSGATGSALEKTRIDAMQYIETRPNTRFKKNIGA